MNIESLAWALVDVRLETISESAVKKWGVRTSPDQWDRVQAQRIKRAYLKREQERRDNED